MNFLLALKHWQLFLLLIVIPVIMEFTGMFSAFSGNFGLVFVLFPLGMTISITVLFGWLYALATNLNKRSPDTVRMKLSKFKIFLFTPLLYILIFSVFMFAMFIKPPLGSSLNPLIFLVILPIHLFCMFCIIYCLYFVSKSLKAVELQRPVTFSDYAGEFFLIWFFPIGVWFIQPKINKMFADSRAAI